MTPLLDPVWPWSTLIAGLSPMALAVLVLGVAGGVATYWLHVFRGVTPAGSPRVRALRGLAVASGMYAVWLLLGVRNSGGLTARLADLAAAAFLMLPLVLIGLTVWTYLGVPGATRGRVASIVTLRILAFLLALLAVFRPSLGVPDKNREPSVIYVVADGSASMTIADETDRRSRWDALLRHLSATGPALSRLREQGQVETAFFKFAADLRDLDPDQPGLADGKRTEVGVALHTLFDRRDDRRPPRAVLVLSDGADNGVRPPALTEAARWRTLPCPIHTFGYGNPSTDDRQSDVSVTAVVVEPAPVPVKGEMTVRATIDAFGFQGRKARVAVFLEDGKEKSARPKEAAYEDVILELTAGNEVRIKCMAPAVPGEVRVTVKVGQPETAEPFPDELNAANNTLSTFATVSKEGVSVLLVDKQRAWEPQLIADALSRDPRIHLYPVWLRREDPGGEDLFQFDRRQYDVIIIGDVTAKQMQAVNPTALADIKKMVDRGAGLVMLGGYATFGNSDWAGTPIADLLPVDLDARGDLDDLRIKMQPTDEGLRRFSYLLRLEDGVKDPRTSWEALATLEGGTRLGKPKTAAGVLAVSGNGGSPLLVAGQYGAGRTLAFAGDTTYRWVRDPKTQAMHARFWRQMVVWLARQDEAEGGVWVKPDTRRLPARSDLGFSVGLRSKGGVALTDGTYQVVVEGPDGVKTPVAVSRTAGEDRGSFTKADAPGEYRVIVHGQGKDADGEPVAGDASARFIVYDDDVELMNRGANHDFLRRLATAGGGQFQRGEELPAFLEKLAVDTQARERPKLDLYPNWRSTSPSLFLVTFLLLFVAVLAAEWTLRRRWGLV